LKENSKTYLLYEKGIIKIHLVVDEIFKKETKMVRIDNICLCVESITGSSTAQPQGLKNVVSNNRFKPLMAMSGGISGTLQI
jgi:hypothetical protein